MEIVCIFDIHNQGLFSIEYDNEPTNEFDRLFALWNDIKYLEEFFHTHQKDLSNTSFYGPISVLRKQYHELWKIEKNFKNEFLRLLKMILKDQNISMTCSVL